MGLPSPMGFPYGSDGTIIYLQCRRPRFDPWVGTNPWRRELLPNPVFLTGELYGQRILVGYSPWGLKELDIFSIYSSLFNKIENKITEIWQ